LEPRKRRRRRLEPAEARERVLAAAEELLRSRGPSSLRLGEIAARAGLSHSNVLYHFDGMHELEARLGERIARGLANEIAGIYARRPADELPLDEANRRLFEVLSEPETARLLWWALVRSEDAELESLAASFRHLCAVIADHPSLRTIPPEKRRRDVALLTEFAMCTALGFGVLKRRSETLFGEKASESTMAALLSGLLRRRPERG
jgi:AcrR family transcriptional regulator